MCSNTHIHIYIHIYILVFSAMKKNVFPLENPVFYFQTVPP